MGLDDFLKKYHKIAIDTNVLISLFAKEPLGEVVFKLVDVVANQGTHELVTSILAFSECIVKPYRDANWAALDQIKLMFQMPNLKVVLIDEIIAEEAARIRAVYNFKMPDAMIIATAIISEVDVFLTNDLQLLSLKEIPVVKLSEL